MVHSCRVQVVTLAEAFLSLCYCRQLSFGLSQLYRLSTVQAVKRQKVQARRLLCLASLSYRSAFFLFGLLCTGRESSEPPTFESSKLPRALPPSGRRRSLSLVLPGVEA